ncbi:hypothetical protein EV360DRAFT_74027 [Lentinula raphanica]|nr:hypothetical protein EV360DRAFT_74027 [Lentinula raphanica]
MVYGDGERIEMMLIQKMLDTVKHRSLGKSLVSGQFILLQEFTQKLSRPQKAPEAYGLIRGYNNQTVLVVLNNRDLPTFLIARCSAHCSAFRLRGKLKVAWPVEFAASKYKIMGGAKGFLMKEVSDIHALNLARPTRCASDSCESLAVFGDFKIFDNMSIRRTGYQWLPAPTYARVIAKLWRVPKDELGREGKRRHVWHRLQSSRFTRDSILRYRAENLSNTMVP